jgi:GST-like protein
MLHLYHWEPSADSAKILICLKEKNLDFNSHYIELLNFEQYSAEHLARAPLGQVPLLVHNGETLVDPKLISYYLVEAFPNPRLAPDDPLGWYNVQAWCNFADFNLGSSVDMLGWNGVMLPAMSESEVKAFKQGLADAPVLNKQAGWNAVFRDAEASEDQLENAKRKVGTAVERMESVLAESPWLVDSEYSIADIYTYALTHTLPRLLPDMVNRGSTPRIMEWLAKMDERPAVKEAMAMRRYARTEDVYAHS